MSHIKSCSDTGINVYVTKGLLININLKVNLNELQIMPVNMVNASML